MYLSWKYITADFQLCLKDKNVQQMTRLNPADICKKKTNIAYRMVTLNLLLNIFSLVICP